MMHNATCRPVGRALTTLVLGSFALSGCLIVAEGDLTGPSVPGATTPAPSANNPQIQALSANPTNVTKGQPITVTIKAADPKQQPLEYTWSATGGTLSTTSGQLVQWTPPTTAGTYTINVLVSNGTGGSTAGSLNLTVDAEGKGSVGASATAPVAKPADPDSEPAQPATPEPAAPEPALPATPDPSKVIFHDSFEQELANWENDYSGEAWHIRRSGAQDGRTALVWGFDRQGQIPARSTYGLNSYWYMTTKTNVDLSNARNPKLRLYVNNGDIPAGVLRYKITVGSAEHTFSPTGQDGWMLKEFDLTNAIGETAKVRIGVAIDNNTNITFAGPMLDNVTIYDAE